MTGEGSSEQLDPLAGEVLGCLERTLAADSARIMVAAAIDFSLPKSKPRRRGGLLRPLLPLAGAAVRATWQQAGERWGSFCFEGYIEPSRRRHLCGSAKGGEVYKQGKRWGGNPGQPLAALNQTGTSSFDIWFLLDALRGLTAATAQGEETVRGTSCRRLDVRVDLAHASAASPAGIHVPRAEVFEDLLAIPLSVWIDGTHVRRVCFEEMQEPQNMLSLELWDFGVSTEGLDWSRVPSWPAEA